MGNKPWPSFIDGVGNGAGYAIILIVVAAIREFFGSGSLMGYKIVPQAFYEAGYINNGMMIMPTMALVLVGVIIWIQRSYFSQLREKE
jgi:Na+-transporting NADH:ubiquinone oxidoreductase subunit D